MNLDLRTLQLAAIVVCCVLGPVSLAFAPSERYMQPFRFWGAGLVALACGLGVRSLSGPAPGFVAQICGLGLFALALSFAHLSARSVADKAGRDVPGLALLGLFVLMLIGLERLSVNGWLSTPLGMAALGILACRTAVGFDASKGLPEGRPLRTIAAIFGIFGLALILQGVVALMPPGANSPIGPGVADPLLLVGMIAGLLLGTIILAWVMSERIGSRIRQLVTLDALTGALNRKAFIDQFEREASRARRRPDLPFATLLIDIDRLRRVNDGFGQAAGDRLIEKTAEILREVNRDYDLVGRLDGDVFMLLVPGARSENAMMMAERVLRAIELEASVRAGLKNRVSASVGIAVFGEHGDSWNSILRAAEAALKYAKTLGGNRARMAAPMPHPSAAESGAAATDAVPE